MGQGSALRHGSLGMVLIAGTGFEAQPEPGGSRCALQAQRSSVAALRFYRHCSRYLAAWQILQATMLRLAYIDFGAAIDAEQSGAEARRFVLRRNSLYACVSAIQDGAMGARWLD